MGTLGYMSPEQVQRQAAPTRGRTSSRSARSSTRCCRAGAPSTGDTAAETMSAILREEPPDLSATNENVQPRSRADRAPLPREEPRGALPLGARPRLRPRGARRASRRTPAVAAAVPGRGSAPRLAPAPRRGPGPRGGSGRAATRRRPRGAGQPPPSFHQLTFRRGADRQARFGSDGKTILYAAAWDGKPIEIYVSRPESPESRALRPAGRRRPRGVDVGRDGGLALTSTPSAPSPGSGTLARVGATGGARAPRAPGGRPVRRLVAGRQRPRHRAGSPEPDAARVSRSARSSTRRPAGSATRASLRRAIASPSWTTRSVGDDGGSVAIVDRAGKKTTLSPLFATARGLAWSPGRLGESGSPRPRWAAIARSTPSRSRAATRLLSRVTGSLTLHDVSRDGRVLMAHDSEPGRAARARRRRARSAICRGSTGACLNDLSADGRTVLFTETGEGGGAGLLRLRPEDGRLAGRSPRRGNGRGRSLAGREAGARAPRLDERPPARDLSDGRGRADGCSRARASTSGARAGCPTAAHPRSTRREPGQPGRASSCGTSREESPAP